MRVTVVAQHTEDEWRHASACHSTRSRGRQKVATCDGNPYWELDLALGGANRRAWRLLPLPMTCGLAHVHVGARSRFAGGVSPVALLGGGFLARPGTLLQPGLPVLP